MSLFRGVDYNELTCDWPVCTKNYGLVVFGEKKRTIRARARNQGWRTVKAGDYCPRHANGMLPI